MTVIINLLIKIDIIKKGRKRNRKSKKNETAGNTRFRKEE
jgi:hypothetical protein